MKRILFSLFLSIMALGAFAQMSDSQIMSFYQREAKAGTSQGQIVTKLMQQGVSIDQIRRVRDQYTNQAKNAANRIRDQLSKSVQSLTQAQVVASMQQVAANRGLLGGISRVAATTFDQADGWAYARMKQLKADPLAGFRLHQKLLERSLLSNAIALDPERMESLQALTEKDGRKEDVVAILKGIRPETLDFDVGDMPLASAPQAFSYDELPNRGRDPYALGLVEAMLGMADTSLPGGAMPSATSR